MERTDNGNKHIISAYVGSQDVDYNGVIRPSRMIAMLQEAGDSHLRSYGIDYQTMVNEDRQAFVVTRMTIEMYRDIRQYTDIAVRTWFDEGKSVNFPRSYDVVADGEVVAKAYSNWGLIDLENGRFVRFKDHVYSNGPFEPNAVLEMPERFRISKELELEYDHSFTVRHAQIDMNNHMNNVMYIDPMWNAIPDAGSYSIASLSIRFIHETLLGEEVEVYRSAIIEEDGRKVIYFRLISGETVRAEGRWTLRSNNNSVK